MTMLAPPIIVVLACAAGLLLLAVVAVPLGHSPLRHDHSLWREPGFRARIPLFSGHRSSR